MLARHFMSELAAEYGKPSARLSDETIRTMSAYGWPGNVRELRNIIERLVIMSPRDQIGASDLPAEIRGDGAPSRSGSSRGGDTEAFLGLASSPSLKEGREQFEKLFIARKLAECGQNVSRAAEALGVERTHLHRKLKAYGLTPQRDE